MSTQELIAPKPRKLKKRMGRPPYIPTEKDRSQVSTLASYGITHEQICKLIINPNSDMPIPVATLRRCFRDELDTAKVKANANIVQSLYRAAVGAKAEFDEKNNCLREEVKPNVVAAIYWTKAQMGWRDQTKLEISGPNGGAIPLVISKNQADY